MLYLWVCWPGFQLMRSGDVKTFSHGYTWTHQCWLTIKKLTAFTSLRDAQCRPDDSPRTMDNWRRVKGIRLIDTLSWRWEGYGLYDYVCVCACAYMCVRLCVRLCVSGMQWSIFCTWYFLCKIQRAIISSSHFFQTTIKIYKKINSFFLSTFWLSIKHTQFIRLELKK